MKKIQGARDFLRQEILRGFYKPGSYLPSVRSLAVRLKLSKSSVHNILKLLQEAGLLALNPGRGALVSEPRPEKNMLKRLFFRPSDFGYFNYLPLMSRLMSGIFAGAERKNVEVNASFSDAAGVTEAIISAWEKGHIQGVIYGQCRNYDGLILPLEKAGIPCVVADDTHGIPAVKCSCDFAAMTRAAIEYLHRYGHTRIALLTGEPTQALYVDSIAAYRETMKKLKLKAYPELVIAQFQDNPGSLLELLSARHAPTAYVTLRDYRARMLYAAAACLRLRVPKNISVISFDDCTWSDAARAGLTTFRDPLEKLGENAVEMLQQWVSDGVRPENRILMPELIERGSVAGVRPESERISI